MSLKEICRILVFFAVTFAVPAVHGEQAGGVEYSGSGFLTVGVGKMLGGTRNNVSDYNCPCFISDYAQAGVYDGRSGLQWRPDSKLGVQGAASLDNQRYSITAQVVARGAGNGNVGLEWLYGSYKPNDNITIQAGRKRLPMFYYSDVQDVGIALPWTHLPPGPYGWEAVNYNGINVRYQDQWNSWSATANLLTGSESKKDSGYWKVYNGRQSRSDIKWSNIVGGDLILVKDWIETRLVYIQSDTQENYADVLWDPATQTYGPASGPIYPPAKQQIFGLTVNTDYQNWLLRTEFIQINHPGLNYRDHAQLVGVGYRFGKWQPMATWSEYRGTAATEGLLPGAMLPFIPNLQQTISLTLRYDLTASSALKAQYDSQTDRSDPNYTPNFGNSRLLTLSYDLIF